MPVVLVVGVVMSLPSSWKVSSYVVRTRYRTKYERASTSKGVRRMAEGAKRHNPRTASSRERLSRERVLRAALAIADSGGLASLTIRSLAEELGAKPMSVYYHVSNKGEILDALVDIVFDEIEVPVPGRA